MAYTTDDIYQFLKFLTNKNQSGDLSVSRFHMIWNGEQRSYQDDLLGRWHPQPNGKEGANTGIILNDVVQSALSPFIKKGTAIAVTSGIATLPADFMRKLAVRINGKGAYELTHAQIATVNDSTIDPPSLTDNRYYYSKYGSTYSVLPASVTTLDLDYISEVTDIVWGSTLDGNNRPVYASGSSVQPKWSSNQIVEITKRCLKTLGVRFHDTDFEKFGQSIINTGS